MHIATIPKTRSGGAHALDFAAYRVGARFVVPATRFSQRERSTKDHRNRPDVVLTKIVRPAKRRTPEWMGDRQTIWTKADAAEARKDSRVAREWIVSLPRDLPLRDAFKLAREIARAIADRFGCVVDLAMHDGVASDGKPNLHVHLLCSTREIGANEFGRKCVIEWSEKALKEHGYDSGPEQIDAVRRDVAALTNRALHTAGAAKRVTHGSYYELGLPLLGHGRFKRHGRPRRRPLAGIVDTQARTSRRRQARAVSDVERRARNAERIAADPVNFLRVMTKLNGELDEVGAAATLRPLVAETDVAGLVELVESAQRAPVQSPLAECLGQSGSQGTMGLLGHSRFAGTCSVDENVEQTLPVGSSPTDLNDFFDPLPGENDAWERCEKEQREAEERQRKSDELYWEHRDRVMKEFDTLYASLNDGSALERTTSVQHADEPKRR